MSGKTFDEAFGDLREAWEVAVAPAKSKLVKLAVMIAGVITMLVEHSLGGSGKMKGMGQP